MTLPSQMIREIEFIHFKEYGFSMGVLVEDKKVFLAASFVHTSKDVFNRHLANLIIANRINSYKYKNVEFVLEQTLSIKGKRIRHDKDKSYKLASILRDKIHDIDFEEHGDTICNDETCDGGDDCTAAVEYDREGIWHDICGVFREIVDAVASGEYKGYFN